jgi:hypothetical protein
MKHSEAQGLLESIIHILNMILQEYLSVNLPVEWQGEPREGALLD